MKIAITGIAGLLGSHVAKKIQELGHEVIGIDNLIGGYIDNIPQDIEFFKWDCIDSNKMASCFKGCEIVVHCACTAHEGLSIFSPNFIYKNTAQISLSVFSSAIQAGVSKILLTSSMARYGNQIAPFTENMECKPVDVYGVAKVSAEQSLKILSDVHGINYNIAVPHNIIGQGQCYCDAFRNVAAIMINCMLQNKPIYIYGDGNQKRSFSFIQDVVNCFEKLIFDDNVNKEIINVGPDEETITINDLFHILKKMTGYSQLPIYVDERPKEVKLAYCSSDKARLLLNYETKTKLNEGLNMMVKWIEKRGPETFKYNLPLEITNDKCPRTWKERLY